MVVPLKLKFKTSESRKEQRRKRSVPIASREGLIQDTERHDSLPGQNLESYLKSSSNTNLYPSLSSLTTVAPYSDAETEMAEPVAQNPNARPRCFRNIFEECIFVFAIMMATSSTTFLQGVIIINTATIGNNLEMSAAQVTWIAAAIGLGSGSFMLFFGKTADLFGRKSQLLGGMAFLSLIALIAAFAPNPMALNVLCGFLGLGTAVINPPAIGMLFTTYPAGRRQNKAAGALGSGNPLGFIFGSISSGVATKIYGWRASFFVISIFFFVLALLSFWTMPNSPRTGSLKTEVKRFDWIGTFTIILGMSLSCAALTEGPVRGWKSRSVIIMLVLGIVLLLGFVFWENIYKCPLLDPSIWKNRNYTLCILCVFFGYMSFITNQFWISLYMQEVQKFTPLNIAVRMLPQAIAGILWSYICQAAVSRMSGTALMVIGAVSYLIGATLQIFIRQHTSYWKLLFPSLLIAVLGADIQFIVASLYINTQMPTRSSLAAGVLQTAMRLSVSVGLSISAAVYGSTISTPEAQKDITFAYGRAYLCSIIFAAIGLILTPLLRIGIQGANPTIDTDKEKGIISGSPTEHQPMTLSAGEYCDSSSQTSPQDNAPSFSGSKTSLATQSTSATYGSENSYFPRWSWESESDWRNARLQQFDDGHIIYEVCIKCLEERRVVLGNYGGPSGARGSYRFEPTPVRGGDLGSLQAKALDIQLQTPTIEQSSEGFAGRRSDWV